MLVILEGGYNTDYIGQHASGVVKALLNVSVKDYGELTQADLDVGLASVYDIKRELATDWAKENVDETKKHLGKYWKLEKKVPVPVAKGVKPVKREENKPAVKPIVRGLKKK